MKKIKSRPDDYIQASNQSLNSQKVFPSLRINSLQKNGFDVHTLLLSYPKNN